MFLFYKIIIWGNYNYFILYKLCVFYYYLLEVIFRIFGRFYVNIVKLIKIIIILEL